MSDESTIQAAINAANAAGTSQTRETSKPSAGIAGKDVIDQEQFLNLLVAQLQQQDPLNPMNSEDFAVQLAQFSQLEQLIGIRDAVEQSSGTSGSVSSMASFLGHEVVLNTEQVSISATGAGNLLLDVPTGMQSGRVDLTNDQGVVVGSVALSDLSAGNQVLRLGESGVAPGDYSARVVGVNSLGVFEEIPYKVTGTVEGFVLEPSPMLIVDGKEVSMDDISEVYQGGV